MTSIFNSLSKRFGKLTPQTQHELAAHVPRCSDVGLETGLGIETGLETIFFEVSAVCRSRLFRPGLGLGLEAKVSVFWSRPARDLYYLL